jgi:hypothetical protein
MFEIVAAVVTALFIALVVVAHAVEAYRAR